MEYKKKTIIWEDNNEPPKNYIWIKNGTIWQFDKYLHKWVEYKKKDEDDEELDLIKYGGLFSGYVITPEEFESGSWLSKYKSIHDRLKQYNETYDFYDKLVDGVYIIPNERNWEGNNEILSYTVLPFEISDVYDGNADLHFHIASEKGIEKYLSTPMEYTDINRNLYDNVFNNSANASINTEHNSESIDNAYIGIITGGGCTVRDGISNLYINHTVINTYQLLGGRDHERLFTNSGEDTFIFFDLPENIAKVDSAEKLHTAIEELANIYEE